VKPTVVVTVLAAVLAIAAGVAIAGLPSTPPGADVRVLEVPTVETRPSETFAPLDIEPTVTTTTTIPTTPIASTTTAVTSTSTTTTDAPASTTTTSTTPTSTTTTEPTDTSGVFVETGDILRSRDELNVATANASAQAGVATAHAELLQGEGYAGVSPVDSEPSATSAVYYEPGFELEAARLATDLGWDPIGLAPMADLPTLLTDQTFQLVALVGLDRA
jgi:hypothetical protein